MKGTQLPDKAESQMLEDMKRIGQHPKPEIHLVGSFAMSLLEKEWADRGERE